MANPSDPVEPTPELRIDDDRASNLCSLGPRPYLITGALVQHLRAHFFSRDQVEDPALKNSLWAAGDATGIVVESITKWVPEEAMTRPAVVVKRNGWQVTRLGIGDQLMGWRSGEDGYDYYLTFLAGSHTLFCLASEAGEAERLTAEVYRELIEFGPVLRKALKLHRLVVAEIGELTALDGEGTDAYLVPVTVAYVFEEGWQVALQAPVLKRIALTSDIDC